MAPLDRLGDEFALGAWVSEGDANSGFLAKCKAFDEDAVSSFFSALQFRGPERFEPADLQPGHRGRVHSNRRGGGTGETRPP